MLRITTTATLVCYSVLKELYQQESILSISCFLYFPIFSPWISQFVIVKQLGDSLFCNKIPIVFKCTYVMSFNNFFIVQNDQNF